MARRGLLRTFQIYVRAFHEARGFRPALALILFAGLVWVPISLLLPLPLKIVLDNVLGGHPLGGIATLFIPDGVAADRQSLLVAAIAISVGLGLLGIVYHFAEWLLRETVAERLVQRFRGRMLRHGMALGALHHSANGALELGYRINQDAPAVQWTAIYGVIPVLVSLGNIACMLIVTAAISPTLALIALATAFPTLSLVYLYQRRLKAKWHAVKVEDSATQALVHEVLGALRLVTLFGQESRETDRFLAHSRRAVAARLRAIRTEGLLAGMLALSTTVGTAAILYLGVRDVVAQALSVGELMMVVTYIGQLYAPLQAIGTHVSGQQHAVASMERALAVLDQKPGVAEQPNALPRGRAHGAIGFDDVSFAYDARNPVLSGASFDIPAGTVVGIVGRTGAGKTTLINLLLRLFDPTEGEIRLDGVDLRDWRLGDLRRQFAVVPQDALLFSTSIAENIAYGKPQASRAEIVAAAKAASAHDFIAALPEGYDTPVGERGLRLSGGERQRIALARALLVDAPLVILDEPTSAIDQETESAIVDGLERLRRSRTVFIIAHRLATLHHVDIRLRVEDGRVVLERDAPELRIAS